MTTEEADNLVEPIAEKMAEEFNSPAGHIDIQTVRQFDDAIYTIMENGLPNYAMAIAKDMRDYLADLWHD
jgi:hypothetical protein